MSKFFSYMYNDFPSTFSRRPILRAFSPRGTDRNSLDLFPFVKWREIVEVYPFTLTLSLPERKIAEFANSVDLDEVAHNEPPHQELRCLPSGL